MNFQLNLDKSKWDPVKLGELANEISVRIENPAELGIEKFVGLEHFVSGNLIIKSYQTTKDLASATKQFQSGDILFARRNPYLRRASMVNFDGVCSGDAFVLRENQDRIITGFLTFIVNSERLWDFANSNAAGTMSKRVKWRDLANYEFLLPPKAQQAEIAELLWAMDEVVQQTTNVLAQLKIYQKFLYKTLSKDNPKWTIYKLKELMQFNYGRGLRESDRVDGDYPVVSSAGIQGTHKHSLVKGPGIVVGRKGNVGEVTWVDDDFWPIDTAYFITVKQDFCHIPLRFFYFMLKSLNLAKHSITTAVPGLNRDDALLTKVYLPGESEIDMYLGKFDLVYDQIMQLRDGIKKSKSLQKSLTNEIF